MIPADLATEATVYREALLGGVVEPAEVVAWADAWILRLDESPDALVEVSYSGQHINEMLVSLNQINTKIWTVIEIRLYFQMLDRYLRADSSRLKTVARAIYRLNLDNEVPETVSAEIYDLDDYLNLVLLDEYGCLDPKFSIEQVYQDVVQALEKWAAPA